MKVQRLGDCVTPLKEDNHLANGKVKLSCVYEIIRNNYTRQVFINRQKKNIHSLDYKRLNK